jgi:hypothetical protein
LYALFHWSKAGKPFFKKKILISFDQAKMGEQCFLPIRIVQFHVVSCAIFDLLNSTISPADQTTRRDDLRSAPCPDARGAVDPEFLMPNCRSSCPVFSLFCQNSEQRKANNS